jgi:hypothetical protein
LLFNFLSSKCFSKSYSLIIINSQDATSSYDDDTEVEPRPSTSRGFRDDEDSSALDEKSRLIKGKDRKGDGEDEGEEKKETETQRKRKLLMAKLMMIPAFISSILVSITLRLHRVSRSYRYVMRVLAREKKILKVNFLMWE